MSSWSRTTTPVCQFTESTEPHPPHVIGVSANSLLDGLYVSQYCCAVGVHTFTSINWRKNKAPPPHFGKFFIFLSMSSNLIFTSSLVAWSGISSRIDFLSAFLISKISLFVK